MQVAQLMHSVETAVTTVQTQVELLQARILTHAHACSRMLPYCSRMLAYAGVCWRRLAYDARMLTYANVAQQNAAEPEPFPRQQTSAYMLTYADVC